MFLKVWIKRIFSDLHSAIVSIIVLSFLGVGTASLASENLYNFLSNILLVPTPLLLTIVLALALYIYIRLRIKSIHSKETPNINNKINVDDYEQPKELGGVSRNKETNKTFCTSCLIKNIKSPMLVNLDEYYWKCPLKDCNKSYKNPSKEISIPKTPGYSFQKK